VLGMGVPVVRAGIALGLPFLWILLVPLGPVGAALAGTRGQLAFALGHGGALLLAGVAGGERLGRWRAWGSFAIAPVAVAVSALTGWPAVVGLAVAGVVATVPVLAAAWELGRLDRGQRALGVALGAALANLPLLVVSAETDTQVLRLVGVLAGVAVLVQPRVLRVGPVPGGPVPWRLVASVAGAYVVGGVTYAVALPALGSGGWGVLPYLGLLPPAALAAGWLGADRAVRLGLGILGFGVLVWALGASVVGSAAVASMVGAWALLDVSWWTRLGEEPAWGRAYAFGLGAMVLAIGLGLLATPAAAGFTGSAVAPLIALVALLLAALAVPADPAALAVREEQALRAQPDWPAALPPGASGTCAMELLRSRYSLSAREAQVLELAIKGLANKEIAGLLGISTGTVRTHLERAYRKLGVSGRLEAAWRLLDHWDDTVTHHRPGAGARARAVTRGRADSRTLDM
jgi:DNA-binding CsgD family transcriptional regulator